MIGHTGWLLDVGGYGQPNPSWWAPSQNRARRSGFLRRSRQLRWYFSLPVRATFLGGFCSKIAKQNCLAKKTRSLNLWNFSIWQYGEWIDVVVDDYLPTINGELIYICSKDKNEFWTALLEKAYAKIHGRWGWFDCGIVVILPPFFVNFFFPFSHWTVTRVLKAVQLQMQWWTSQVAVVK